MIYSHIVMIIIFTIGLVACSQKMNVVANRGGSNTPSEIDSLASVLDESINNAGVNLINQDLILTTIASPANPVGAFVGGGQGNKSLAGLADFDRFALAELNKISFEAKTLSSSGYMYLNLVVDLDCVLDESDTATIADLRANRKILIASIFTQTAKDNDYREYSILKDDAHWLAVGGAGGLPSSEPGGTLGTFIASYPNACIVNVTSADGGLGRQVGVGCQTGAALATTAPGYCGKPTSGVLLILGDSVNLSAHEWSVRKITINNHEYSGL